MSDTVALPDNIIDIDSFDESVNMLIYGPSGCGKTVFGGSGEKVLYLAIEKGTVSAKRLGANAKVWPVHEWDDLEKAYNWLVANPNHGFKWLVIDSITQMQQMAIRDILKKENKKNGSRDLDIPAIQDHQKWQNLFKRFIEYFVELPIDTVYIALVQTLQDEEKEDYLAPDLQGKKGQIASYVAGQMSCYGYMSNRKVAMRDEDGELILDAGGKKVPEIVRRITWMDTGTIRGKDRYNVLAPFTEDITLTDALDLIEGNKTREDLGQFVRKMKASDDEKKVEAASEGKSTAAATKAGGRDRRTKSKVEDKPKPEVVVTKAEDDPKEDDGFGEAEEVAKAKASEEAEGSEKVADVNKEGDDSFDFDADATDFDFD